MPTSEEATRPNLRNDLFRYALTEVPLRHVFPEIFKRKHGNHRNILLEPMGATQTSTRRRPGCQRAQPLAFAANVAILEKL